MVLFYLFIHYYAVFLTIHKAFFLQYNGFLALVLMIQDSFGSQVVGHSIGPLNLEQLSYLSVLKVQKKGYRTIQPKKMKKLNWKNLT